MCHESFYEELQGDLEESFQSNARMHGVRRARWIYRWEVLKMLRPTVLRSWSFRRQQAYAWSLVGSYVTVAIRNIRRHPLFSMINVFSLSVAMSVGLLVIGMINDLMKFDQFHERKYQIYRVLSQPEFQMHRQKWRATSPLPLGEELINAVPGIQVTQLGRNLSDIAEIDDRRLRIRGIYADKHFFDFLSFDLLHGDARQALAEPFSVVLSETAAAKIFADRPALGQVIQLEQLGNVVVTGIAKDPPRFSHIQFEAIASLATLDALEKRNQQRSSMADWGNLDRYYNYLFIPDESAQERVTSFLTSYAPDYFKEPEDFRATFELQRIDRILPGRDLSDQIGPKMIMLPNIILSAIAFAILVSAIFNYTNLSMARALRRTREVGIRKVSGATGRDIYTQFTFETITISLLSLLFGIGLFTVLRPHFLQLIPRASEVLELQLDATLLGWFVLFAVVTGLLAGIAPSLFFSRLSSLKSLRFKGAIRSISGLSARKALIVAQFALSMIFSLAIVITYRQYQYSVNYDLGMDKENILNISLDGSDPEILKTGLLQMPEVSTVSFSSFVPGIGAKDVVQMLDPRNGDTLWIHSMSVNHEFVRNVDLNLVAGREFEGRGNRATEQSVLVNETFIERFGWESPHEALDATIQVAGNTVVIAGVLQDFIYANLEERIAPLVVRQLPFTRWANVKLQSTDISATIADIEELWLDAGGRGHLNARFFDDQVDGYYQFFVDIVKLFSFLGFVALSISTLGLFGIAVYSMEVRQKEIGVRKTFGASALSLLMLLTGGFMRLIVIAVFIGAPVSYLLFDRLILPQQYYRITIGVLEVGTSVGALILVALLTIGSQTFRAAHTNPATILRTE